MAAGDDHHPTPYAYVSPWTKRSGPLWNAPFGALYPLNPAHDVDALTSRIVDFFERGRRRARIRQHPVRLGCGMSLRLCQSGLPLSGYHRVRMTETLEDESAVVAALRDGDETVFAQLVDRHTPSMLRVARGYVPSHEIAEDVVQETWIALIKGIDKFEGRSSLRTWLFSVMINIAKARGVRERRDADMAIVAFTGGSVDPARFRTGDDPYPGHWKADEQPSPFPETPEGSVLGNELVDIARRELDKLPERQRMVVTMRDVLGFDSSEVCELLDISMANQRVLLHRGRASVRQVLEDYLRDTA